jgi:hypothetical protein
MLHTTGRECRQPLRPAGTSPDELAGHGQSPGRRLQQDIVAVSPSRVTSARPGPDPPGLSRSCGCTARCRTAAKYWVGAAQPDKPGGELGEQLKVARSVPVHPGDFVVLAVGVVLPP